MSEYQYYEWLALDRPLDDKQLDEVSRLSSHMDQVTPTQATVTYSWGDFKHDPLKVLVRYFDAFLYVANWGTRRLAFRFPKAAIATGALKPYLFGDVVTVKQDGAFTLLNIEIDDEGGGDWVDVEGMLGKVAGVRRQLINGDYRALYLIWLATISRHNHGGDDDYEEYDEDETQDGDAVASTEPPVPAGLRTLDGSLAALCELFDIDRHLVEAAAATSSKAAEPSPSDLRAAIAKLPRERADAYLLRLLDEEPQLGSALRNELGLNRVSATQRDGKGRTARALLDEAKVLTQRAQQREQKRAEQTRIAELEKLATREDSAWQAVDILLRQQKASSYDAAVRQLSNLRDLARYRDSADAFTARLAKVVAQFGKSRALMNRLSKAHLL